MAQFNIEDLSINPEEASQIAELIIERALVQGALSDVHDIVTGITHKKQIPFAGRMQDGLKKSTGCVPNAAQGITMTEKFWEPEMYDARWTHCAKDLDSLLKIFKKAQKINPDFYDRIDSEELGILYAFIDKMMIEVLPEKVWFSDKDADVIANGGVFSAGTDLDYYNVINGIFKEIFADALIPKVAITKNAGATYTAQELAEDDAYNTFKAMVKKADSRLLEDGSAFILCTRSMAENYSDTLREKTLGAGFIEVTENGKTTYKFDGYPIVVKHEWDRFIKAHQNNGTVLNLPHRAIMTVKENIPVGTTSTDDFETLDSFYDRTLKSNIIDAALSLDAKHLESYMTCVAY